MKSADFKSFRYKTLNLIDYWKEYIVNNEFCNTNTKPFGLLWERKEGDRKSKEIFIYFGHMG